jgi:hypothetical protein
MIVIAHVKGKTRFWDLPKCCVDMTQVKKHDPKKCKDCKRSRGLLHWHINFDPTFDKVYIVDE